MLNLDLKRIDMGYTGNTERSSLKVRVNIPSLMLDDSGACGISVAVIGYRY